MKDSGRIAILGAGLAGLSAAYHLKRTDRVVYEEKPYEGGHAYSHEIEGFIFDEGPHVSFTKNPKVKDLFAASVAGQYYEFPSNVYNYYGGHLLKHPVQTNMYGLPEELVELCVRDMADRRNDGGEARNYAEWCYSHLGRAFSEEFTFRYTRKYWTVEPEELTADWIGPRVYSPTLKEVINGATKPRQDNTYYIDHFRYPIHGGFRSYTRVLSEGLSIKLDHKLVELDLKHRMLTFSNGRSEYYDHLISSVPLPELVASIKDAPSQILEAARDLACSSIVLVNIGLRDAEVPPYHWLYFYDENILFSRVSFPSNLSPNNAPVGHTSLQAEVYYSKYRPLETEDVISRVVEDLSKVGLLKSHRDVVLCQEQHIPYGNVIFDHKRARSLEIILGFLDQAGIRVCGRYGEWAYFWSDDAVLSGERAAKSLVNSIRQKIQAKNA